MTSPSKPQPEHDHNKVVANYKADFVACRSGQHRWPHYSQWHWKVTRGLRGKPLAYRTTLVCEVCHMIATDTIDANNGDRQRAYRQPEGYRIPKDADVSRSDLRLELINRVAKNAEEESA